MGVNILQNRRRMIMAAQPHLETVSGGVANFVADMSLPLKECKVTFLPKQSGSGDPSPENVRPISGWEGLSVHVSPTTTGGTEYPVSWQSAGTVYGGYVDLVRGVLVAEYVGYTLDGTEYWTHSQSGNLYMGTLVPKSSGLEVANSSGTIYASYAKSSSSSSAWNIFIGSTGNILIYLPTEIDNANALKQYIAEHPLQIVYQLATPITYTLTPQQITTLIGTNNIWSDAGDVELTYWSNR